jgi:hypothetical protein
MKLVDTARQQATSQIGMQQQRVAGTLNTVATALHDASREMRKQDEGPIADYVDTAASQVEHVANMLREQDLEQLMNTTAQFARRQPALFLGAAFALGFAATRFIKSSTPSGGQMRSGDQGLWYERPDGYGSSSYSSGYGYGGAVSDLGYGGSTGSTGQMGVASSTGSSGGMGSSGTMGSGTTMGSSGTMGSTSSSGAGGSAGSGSFGASSGSGASGAGGSKGSGGSGGSGGSASSRSQGGSGTGGGSRSGSEGQSRSNASSGAEGQ